MNCRKQRALQAQNTDGLQRSCRAKFVAGSTNLEGLSRSCAIGLQRVLMGSDTHAATRRRWRGGAPLIISHRNMYLNMTAVFQVERHGAAHDAGADESNV